MGRSLLLTFIKQRIPDVPLAPLWEPPGHVPGELLPIDDEAPQAEPFERSGTASHSTLTQGPLTLIELT